MDYTRRFDELHNILSAHLDFLNTEQIDLYPNGASPIYEKWAHEIGLLSAEELIDLENELKIPEQLSESLNHLLKSLKQLTVVQKHKKAPTELPVTITQKFTPKKKHEIQSICSLLEGKIPHKITDIGSGAGHLSRSLCYLSNESTSECLDGDIKLQEIGANFLDKFYPNIKKRITFTPKYIKTDKDLEPFISNENLTLGLHCCGDLSVNILKTKPKHLVSFGCCYHKMENGYPLSNRGIKKALKLNKCSLTLATKNFFSQSPEGIKQRQLVKSFRYTLDILHFKKVGTLHPSTGNTNKHIKKYPHFSEYVAKYSNIEFPDHLDLEKEYIEHLADVNKYINLSTLRNLFGRAIELYILIDRLLYMNTEGSFSIVEVFDKRKSPRNIAIVSDDLYTSRS